MRGWLYFGCQISLMRHMKINAVFNTARFIYGCHDSVIMYRNTGESSASLVSYVAVTSVA